MSDSSGGVTQLAGRTLMSLIFLFSGIGKVMAYSTIVRFAAMKHLPLAPVAIAVAAVIEILGGLAILTGFHTRIVGWILFLYLIPTTVIFHNFWAMQGMERMDNQAHFMKNLAIMGGLLILTSSGPGALSFDASRPAKA
ncbi:MAG TPA: DoxX family protein [Verrucomicrobiae bacterium]|nr:DoxX family protein [Verrucomicrobiae bacterium]